MTFENNENRAKEILGFDEDDLSKDRDNLNKRIKKMANLSSVEKMEIAKQTNELNRKRLILAVFQFNGRILTHEEASEIDANLMQILIHKNPAVTKELYSKYLDLTGYFEMRKKDFDLISKILHDPENLD